MCINIISRFLLRLKVMQNAHNSTYMKMQYNWWYLYLIVMGEVCKYLGNPTTEKDFRSTNTQVPEPARKILNYSLRHQKRAQKYPKIWITHPPEQMLRVLIVIPAKNWKYPTSPMPGKSLPVSSLIIWHRHIVVTCKYNV